MGCGSSGMFGEAIAHGLFPDPDAFPSSSLYARHFFDHNRRPIALAANAAPAAGAAAAGGDAKYAVNSNLAIDNFEVVDEEAVLNGTAASGSGAGGLGGAAASAGAGSVVGGGDVIQPRFSCGVARNTLHGAGRKIREYYLAIGLQSSYDGKAGFRAPLRLVFILDVSGSMAREYSALNLELTKLDLAKAAILHLVESVAVGSVGAAGAAELKDAKPNRKRLLTENDYVSVICVNEDVNILLPMTNAAQIDLPRFRQQLLAVRAIGGSNLKAGVVVATAIVDAHERAFSGAAAAAGAPAAAALPTPSAPASADVLGGAAAAATSAGSAPVSPSGVNVSEDAKSRAAAGAGAAGGVRKLSSRLILISDLKPSMGEPAPKVAGQPNRIDPNTGEPVGVHSNWQPNWHVTGHSVPGPLAPDENRPAAAAEKGPELGYLGLLAQNTSKNRVGGIIYTTVFGVGLDMDVNVGRAVNQMRGSNFFSAGSVDLANNRFLDLLDAEFEFLTTPVATNLKMELHASPFEIEKIYGWEPAPDAPAPTHSQWEEDFTQYDNGSKMLSSSSYNYRDYSSRVNMSSFDGEFLRIKTMFPTPLGGAGGDAKGQVVKKGGMILLKLHQKFMGYNKSDEHKDAVKKVFNRPNMRIALRFEDIFGIVRRKFYRVSFPADSLALTPEDSALETFQPLYDSSGVRKAILLAHYWTIVHQLLAQRMMYEHDYAMVNELRAHFEAEAASIGVDDPLKEELELLGKLPKVAPQPEKCCTIL